MTTAKMTTPEASQAAQAVGIPVHRRVRPLVWARKDQLQHASTRGGLMCAMYPHTDSRADLQPLYDQAALDAAVAAERERLIEALRREALNKWTVRSHEAFAWAQAALERA